MRNNMGLYRGKRLEDGKWQIGCLLKYGCRCFIIPSEELIESEVESRFYWHLLEKHYEVDPETVGQFTGENDRHGVKIFEADIVRCGTGRICKVLSFTSPCFNGFDLIAVSGFDAPPPHEWSLFTDTEVIGNVYDNPELIKKYLNDFSEREKLNSDEGGE